MQIETRPSKVGALLTSLGLYTQSQKAPQSNQVRKEIGKEAIWTLSSAKAGNGVE